MVPFRLQHLKINFPKAGHFKKYRNFFLPQSTSIVFPSASKSLAALIFESHDFNLEIESSVGVGTTMSVIFDVYEEKEYIHEEEA